MGLTSPSGVFNAGEVFRTNAPTTASTFWRMFRGGTEAGNIFNLAGDVHFRIQAMQNNSDIVFHSEFNNTSTFTGTERMRISNVVVPVSILVNTPGGSNVTRVTVSEFPTQAISVPLSLLHIGNNAPSILQANNDHKGGGYRNWMDVGTYTGSGSDNMYVGMKHETVGEPIGWDDNQSSVISWGDNPLVANDANRLRFIFTSPINTGKLSASQNGLEIARMTSNGDNGRMGIGDFFTTSADPLNTLEIRSNPTFGDTRSGLRFTNLTSAMPVDVAITNNKVLSVNSTGDVILVDDQGGSIGTCLAPTLLTNNGAISLNANNFYFLGKTNTENVAVGVPCGNFLSAKFNVGGNAIIGENYITNTIAAPTNGLLVEGFTGIGADFNSTNQP